MGKHASSPVSDKPQDMLIWDRLTLIVEKHMAEHPRRFWDIKPGTDIVVHDPAMGKQFGGIVIALDPLQITWRY